MRPWGQIFLACNLKCVFFSLKRVYVEATYFSQFYHCPQVCLLFAICYLIIPVAFSFSNVLQKQFLNGVLVKRCSENMQQIYLRTSLRTCDFNKVTKKQRNFIEIPLPHGVLL